MIDVVGVCKRFDALMGLHEVTFQVQPGECLGVLGPDGAGKSTLLRCLGGRLKPEEGTVTIGGIAVDRPNLREIDRQVAFLDLNEREISDLTVMQNVLLGRMGRGCVRKKVTSEEDRRLALEALEAVDLGPLAAERVANLDEGGRQRLRLARLLANEPRVLLVDGPFTQLEESEARELIHVLKRLRQSRRLTIVGSFRYPRYALDLVDTILGLRLGEVQYFGPAITITPDALARIFGTEPTDWEASGPRN